MLTLLKSAALNGILLLWHKIKQTSLFVIVARRIFLLGPCLFMLFLSSCLKDDLDLDKLKNPDWQPGIAVPLAQSSLSILDLMKTETDSGILVIDSANFCTLYYTGRALDLKASDLVTLSPQGSNHSVVVDGAVANLINQAGQAAFSYSTVIDYVTPGGALIDSVFYKSGNLILQINSRIPAHTTLTVTVPGATLDYLPFTETVYLEYLGTIPVSSEIRIDLSKYKIDLTDNGTTSNRMRILYDVAIATAGTQVQAGDRINTQFNIYTTEFRKLFGYFGQQGFISPYDTLQLTVFNAFQNAGSFTIAKPEINIDIVNSIGVPVSAQVASMTGINSSQTSFTPATGFPNPLPVVSPTLQQIGQSLTGSFSLNSLNSNVVQLIQEQPKFLVSQIQTATNPNGNTGVNFITDSSHLAVDVEVKLPLFGTVSDFMLYDTLDFNYSNLQNVNELLVRTYIVNGFPFEADWQVYFADANFNKLDSLVSQNKILMPSAMVNQATGLVTGPVSVTIDNTLDRSRILHVMNSKKLLIKAGISSFNGSQTNVKIYADYQFTIHLGAIAKVIL